MALDRISVQSNQLGGAPCIRGLRIPVSVVLDMVASGLSTAEILDLYPNLEAEDITQALHYGAETVGTISPTTFAFRPFLPTR